MDERVLKSLILPIDDGQGNVDDVKYLIPQGTVTEADLEGLKENGTVANARQLIPSAMETERVPYNFRTSGGSLDIGDREFDKLVGLSLPWNQIAKALNSSNWNGSNSTVTFADGVATFTATARYGGILPNGNANRPSLVSGHKYLITAEIKKGSASSNMALFFNSGTQEYYGLAQTTDWQTISKIQASTTTGLGQVAVQDNSESDWAENKVRNLMIIDLTQLFGSTIADYIYSLETATAGAGVAWFKKFFPKQYYAYNSGEIESVKVSSHDMVGFNQWDEVSEQGAINMTTGQNEANTSVYRSKNYIPCLPNTSYCYTNLNSSSGIRIAFYDENKNFVSPLVNNNATPQTFTTPSNAHYLRFYAGDVSKICINLHWDGARDGEYEPYKKNSYALDPIELRGILKLDSNNEPYADGDTYEADGTVTRRYGIVDLGTLAWDSWTYEAENITYFLAPLSGAPANTSLGYVGACDKYPCFDYANNQGQSWYKLMPDKTFIYSVSGISSAVRVYIRDDSYSTPEAFKTAMSGVYLVYELATPTTESADPFTDPQTVDSWGTEQYVDKAYTDGDRDVEIPCGHETRYPMNLRDKIETSPNAPTSDGDYIVHCESGQLTYIALGSTTTIQNIIARLEALEG